MVTSCLPLDINQAMGLTHSHMTGIKHNCLKLSYQVTTTQCDRHA